RGLPELGGRRPDCDKLKLEAIALRPVPPESIARKVGVGSGEFHARVRERSDGSARVLWVADSIAKRRLLVAREEENLVERFNFLHGQDVWSQWCDVLRLPPETSHTTVPGDQPHAERIVVVRRSSVSQFAGHHVTART